MTRRKLGWALIVAGIVLVVAFTGITWAQTTAAPSWDSDQSLLVGVQGPGDHGKVVEYGPDGERRWSVARAASYHDVTRLDDGRVLVTFVVDEPSEEWCEPYDGGCGRTGIRILEPDPENDTAEIVESWSYPVRSVPNSEVHDAERLPNGRYLIVGMDRERVFSVDISTGDVNHIWNASSYYEAPPDATKTDWLHMNDVDRLDDGRIMVSVRNKHQILMLAPNGTVVETVNQHGDPGVIDAQHNPQYLEDGRILVGDSENDRVVELERQDGRWVPVWSVHQASGTQFSWPRDADRLPNGNTLITDSRNHRVLIVDENGDVVASKRTPALPYEADLGNGEGGGGLPEQTGEAEIDNSGTGYVDFLWAAIVHTVPVPWWLTKWHLLSVVAGLTLANLGWMVLRTVPSEQARETRLQTDPTPTDD